MTHNKPMRRLSKLHRSIFVLVEPHFVQRATKLVNVFLRFDAERPKLNDPAIETRPRRPAAVRAR
jgi:hypothetical protein